MKLTAKMKEPLLTQADLDAYEVEVGILPEMYDKKANKPKGKKAGTHYSRLAGGLVRYRRKNSKATIGQVEGWLDDRYGWLQKVIDEDNENEADLKEVIKRLSSLFGKDDESLKKRYLNACRALVRNPILRKEFGSNAPSTIKQKGFDHPMRDTGKFFKAINAQFVRKGGK